MKKIIFSLAFALSACSHHATTENGENAKIENRSPASFADDSTFDEGVSTKTWKSYVGSTLQKQMNFWAGQELHGRAALLLSGQEPSDLGASCDVSIEAGSAVAKVSFSIPSRNYSKSYTLYGEGAVVAYYGKDSVNMTYTDRLMGLSFTFDGNGFVSAKRLTEIIFPTENRRSYICNISE